VHLDLATLTLQALLLAPLLLSGMTLRVAACAPMRRCAA
jgi:hypothetical protein